MASHRKRHDRALPEGLHAPEAIGADRGGVSRVPPKPVYPAGAAPGDDRLGLVARLTGVVMGAGPLVRQAQEMAEQVRGIFNADACVIRLIEGDDLVLLAGSGVPEANLYPRIPIGWGISREIIGDRRPIFIPDAPTHPATASVAKRLPHGYQFISYAGTPLLRQDDPIGIFGIYWQERVRTFTDADLDWLRILANNISVAILNEQLYDKVRRQNAALEVEVAERRRVAQLICEERDRAQQYLDIAGVVLVALDPDGRVAMINRKGCELLGYDEAELRGENWFDTCVPPWDRERVRAAFRSLMAGETAGTGRLENSVLTRDGRERLVQWRNTLLRDSAGSITSTLSSGEDVTEHRRLEQQILQTQKMESIGTLAGGIAHDFGNILAVVMGNVSVCQRQPGLSTKMAGMLTDIAKAAERGAALTHQLLAYARGGARTKVPVDLNRVVQTVRTLFSRVSATMRVHLTLEEGLPQILADVTQIEQVVMNLCLNAIQASKPAGRIEVTTDVQVLDAVEARTLQLSAGRYVRFRVRDEGTGMDEATRERIFEPFFTTKPMGRGMGLSACLGIVRGHDGQIRVQSAPDRGTTVSVWLPVAPDQPVPQRHRPLDRQRVPAP